MIKDVRVKRGLSQRDLAQLAGVNVRTLQSYEASYGGRDIDSAKLETLIDFAIALDCPIRDLLDSEELKKKCEGVEL